MLRTASGSLQSPASPASLLVTSGHQSGIGLSDGKVITSSVGPLVLSRSELDSEGLLRSITAEVRELKRSATALNEERHALSLLLQNAITSYVMLKEGRDNYKGQGHYDLSYIRGSTALKAHRKRDIEAIDVLIKEAATKELPPVTLASMLYRYLNTIRTGVKFLWIFNVGNSSDLRSHLHNSLKSFDPMLYWVCFIDQVENYHQYQQQKPDTAKLRLASSMKTEISKCSVSVEQYQLLKDELFASKRELVDIKSQYAELEDENVAMSTVVNRQKQRIHELETMGGEHKAHGVGGDTPKIFVGLGGAVLASGASRVEHPKTGVACVTGGTDVKRCR